MAGKEIKQELEGLKERVAVLESKMEGEQQTISRSMDLSTFVQEFGPSNHSERATAIAYYLEAYKDQETFTVKDIRTGYEQCRFSPPANMSDALASCEDKGWVMRKGKDGQTTIRQLTKSGIEKVEEVLDNES
ncbi:hypothetical protein [Natronorubrum daqingense]|uniref:MarR family transcriptional regulator n=1 Tax=Natronorubrum daqingense TaxID=588898 RepID=A0A1N6YAW7_9EURY|nr:hypothetical protein [Natronorubrum daqingense]APX95723.1 hypothetical protein BB347_03325 [Natronorubrum daqingense]SIR11621.1 hypothetical protein SAMN05421809_0379 [Natronorubrum daqingense]